MDRREEGGREVTTQTTLPTEDEVRSADPWRYELLLFPELHPLAPTTAYQLWDMLRGTGWGLSLSYNAHGTICFATNNEDDDGVVSLGIDNAIDPTDDLIRLAMVARLRDLTRGERNVG
jgi:hypothetical protein